MSSKFMLLQAIIKYWYGPYAVIIVCSILNESRCTLNFLCEKSGLPLAVIQNILLVLINQSIVKFFKQKNSANKENIIYFCSEDRIIDILSQNKYLIWAEKNFGIPGFYLLLQLIRQGYQCEKVLINEALNLYHMFSNSILKNLDKINLNQNILSKTLKKMLETEIILKFDNPDDLNAHNKFSLEDNFFSMQSIKHPNKSEKKNLQRTINGYNDDLINYSWSNSSSPYETTNNLLDFTSNLNINQGELTSLNEFLREPNVQNIENPNLFSETSGLNDTYNEKLIFFPNYKQLNLELYKQIAEDFILAKNKEHILTRTIVRILLATLRYNDKQIKTRELSFEEIYSTAIYLIAEITDKNITKKISTEEVFATLKHLVSNGNKIIKEIKKKDSLNYLIDWNNCVKSIVNRCIHQYVNTRFGINAARIFQVLLDLNSSKFQNKTQIDKVNTTGNFMNYKKLWNDFEISEIALISIVEARKNLTLLASAELITQFTADIVGINLNDLPNSSPKHTWVFGVNEKNFRETIIKVCYKYLLNLLERQAIEIQKLQLILVNTRNLDSEQEKILISREYAEDLLDNAINGIVEILIISREL